MGRYVEEALDAGAIGVSSGLIYAPGVHAAPDEVAALVAVGGPPRRAVRHPHAQRVGGRPRLARRGDLDDPGRRRAGRTARPPPGLAPQGGRARRLGHGGRAGRADRERPGATASTPAPTSTRTRRPRRRCRRSCRRRSSPCPSPTPRLLIRDEDARATIRDLMQTASPAGRTSSLDPGWAGIVISRSGSRPEWDGRSVRRSPDELGGDPADLALDVLADDRLSTDIVIHCMSEAGRRDDHARALDRRLHRRRGPPARPPDPGPGRAAPPHVRVDRPRARPLRRATRASSISRRPSRS